MFFYFSFQRRGLKHEKSLILNEKVMKLIKITIIILIIICFNINAQEKTQVVNIGKPINKIETIDYAPTISSDGKMMIFESDRNNGWKLYQTFKNDDGTWSEPIYISKINDSGKGTDFIGGPFLTYDNNYLYFTSDRAGSIGGTDIWYSKRIGDDWSEPVNIGVPVNSSEYDGFPSLSPDGNSLYFMRDNSEGMLDKTICYDIYLSKKDNQGNWSEPEKLLKPINLRCQSHPRIMADGKTLIFSSIIGNDKKDFDLYKSVLQDDGTWSEPQNLDFINSEDDDKLITVPASGETMYFVREINGKDDIFYANIPQPFRQIKAIVVKGTIKDKLTGKPLKAKLNITDMNKNISIAEIDNSESDGKYMTVLTEGAKYDFSAYADNYSFSSKILDLTKLEEYKEIIWDIELSPLKKEMSFTLNSVLFEYNSYQLSDDSKFELNRVIKILNENPKIKVEISAHTDSIGGDNYNFELSQKRASSVVDYIIIGGIEKKRVIPKGYGEKIPKASNSTPEGRAVNRRVEFKIIE